MRHGMHQSAHTSTKTGIGDSSTSFLKFKSVISTGFIIYLLESLMGARTFLSAMRIAADKNVRAPLHVFSLLLSLILMQVGYRRLHSFCNNSMQPSVFSYRMQY